MDRYIPCPNELPGMKKGPGSYYLASDVDERIAVLDSKVTDLEAIRESLASGQDRLWLKINELQCAKESLECEVKQLNEELHKERG